MITTQQLELYRQDFALATTIEGDVEKKLYNWLRKEKSVEMVVKIAANTGLGYAHKVADGDGTPVDVPSKLPQLTLTQMERSKLVEFTLAAQQFDLYNKVTEMGKSASLAIELSQERDAANLMLNNAFNSAYPIATGSALYSDSHTLGSQTLDNKASAGALSQSTLEDAIEALLAQKGPKGEPMFSRGKWYLLHSPQDYFVANKLAESTQVIGSNNNDKNIAAAMIMPMMVPEATSTTAWALVPQKSDEAFGFKIERTSMGTVSDVDKQGTMSLKKYSFYELGFAAPYNTYGNAGA